MRHQEEWGRGGGGIRPTHEYNIFEIITDSVISIHGYSIFEKNRRLYPFLYISLYGYGIFWIIVDFRNYTLLYGYNIFEK